MMKLTETKSGKKKQNIRNKAQTETHIDAKFKVTELQKYLRPTSSLILFFQDTPKTMPESDLNKTTILYREI